jgi:hypothetical protein
MLLTRGRGGDYIEPSASTLEAVRIQIEKFVWVKEWESESESIDDPKRRPETGALPSRPEGRGGIWGRSAACKKRGGIWDGAPAARQSLGGRGME